jgi:hypothetical protein
MDFQLLRRALLDAETPPPLARTGDADVPSGRMASGGGADGAAGPSEVDGSLRAEAERLVEDGTRLRITIDTLVRGSLFEAKELVR